MVNRVVEISESLGMKVKIEKTEIQHMEMVPMDYQIVIKIQNLKHTLSI